MYYIINIIDIMYVLLYYYRHIVYHSIVFIEYLDHYIIRNRHRIHKDGPSMTILFLRATRYRCQEYAKEQLLSSFSRKSGVGYLSSLELALEAKVSNSDIPCVYSLHKVRPLWCIFFVAK